MGVAYADDSVDAVGTGRRRVGPPLGLQLLAMAAMGLRPLSWEPRRGFELAPGTQRKPLFVTTVVLAGTEDVVVAVASPPGDEGNSNRRQ